MKLLEFISIISFLLAASAGEDSYGTAILLVLLSGICAVLSMVPARKKVKKCHRR